MGLLLANRLYNSRLASAKDTSYKFDSSKRDSITNAASSMLLRLPPSISTTTTQLSPRPSMQASGIIGLNVASPKAGPFASPLIRPLSPTPLATPGAGAGAGISSLSLSSASASGTGTGTG